MNRQKLNAAADASHLAAQLLVSAGCTDDTDEGSAPLRFIPNRR